MPVSINGSTGITGAINIQAAGSVLTGVTTITDNSTTGLVISGIATVSAGSTSAPSIAPSGDTNTGLFFPSADTIAFTSGGTERGRWISGGGLTFNGDTAAANALDDYEEGTWSPTISFGGASTGITYNAATGGYYTKIGRVVYIHGYLALSNKGSSTGFARLGGLPFNIAQSGEITNVSFVPGYYGNITYSGTLGLWAGSQGNNTFRFIANASGGGITNLTDTAFTNSSDMMIALWYVAT